MQADTTRGFILPFSLVLAASILFAATLVLHEAAYENAAARRELLRGRTRAILQAQVAPLVARLERDVLQARAVSAFLPAEGAAALAGTTVAFHAGVREPLPLYSRINDNDPDTAAFRSPASDARMLAGWASFSPPDQPLHARLAWAAEDIALTAGPGPPPGFWPRPAWTGLDPDAAAGLDVFLDAQMGAGWDQLPWVPAGEPLPFSPALSPALVPVPARLGLRFGIFASGAIGSRERIVRIRYYLEGALWNPYNRPLVMHAKGGLEPVIRMALRNLPEVRIRNLSRGIATGWIALDTAANEAVGARGIHGFIRCPPVLQAGETMAFLEPDSRSQPEGLARTLSPGFMVGPADHVTVEFRPAAGPLQIALMQAGTDDPVEAVGAGAGWFRAEGFAAGFPETDFPRADDGDQPFYLEAGSLAFRIGHCRLQLLLDRASAIAALAADPRRASVRADGPVIDVMGNWIQGADLAACSVTDLSRSPPAAMASAPPAPLFSWPAQRPATILDATDLPRWTNAFRLGSAAAHTLNRLLENGLSAAAVHPVNLLNKETWLQLLAASAAQAQPDGGLRFAAYPQADPARDADYRAWSPLQVNAALDHLVEELRRDPCRSVAEFHDRGLLARAFTPATAGDPLHALLPLRGWLRHAPVLRNHGRAWILHLAIIAEEESFTERRSARVWLLETAAPGAPPAFMVVRFESTDPDAHLPIK